jgi:hypothetical protein
MMMILVLVAERPEGSVGFWLFRVGSLHEFVGWFLGRVPLDHLPSANITIDAATVSNGQFGIAHVVLRPAVPTDKLFAIGECWGAHRSIVCASATPNASAMRRRYCGVELASVEDAVSDVDELIITVRVEVEVRPDWSAAT